MTVLPSQPLFQCPSIFTDTLGIQSAHVAILSLKLILAQKLRWLDAEIGEPNFHAPFCEAISVTWKFKVSACMASVLHDVLTMLYSFIGLFNFNFVTFRYIALSP